MSSEQFTFNSQSLQLKRFPENQNNRSLQAWDAADEYLIEYVTQSYPSAKNIFILNDTFGALACFFSDKKRAFISDSLVSRLGCQANLTLNQLNSANIDFYSCLQQPDFEPELVLIKIPKIAGLLSEQLSQLSHLLPSNTPIVAAGKAKDIHTSTIKTFEHFTGETKTSLAKKKSRLIFSAQKHKPQNSHYPVRWKLEGTPFTLFNHANVFSKDSLDIGARFFLDFLPKTEHAIRVIDLGCGNGVLGLMALHQSPNAQITFVDESQMAIESAKLNIEHNMADKIDQCDFLQNDCLSGLATSSTDLILCNPPFHQQQAVTDHIAWQMLKQSKEVLRKGGEIRIVGNRHLKYHEKLKRLFGGYKLLGSNKKFVVLSAKNN